MTTEIPTPEQVDNLIALVGEVVSQNSFRQVALTTAVQQTQAAAQVAAGALAAIQAIPGGASGLTLQDKTKLDSIASGATANAADAFLRNRANHEGTQAANTVEGLPAALTKLDTVAQGATANANDTFLRNRGNHQGTQAPDTVEGLPAALTKLGTVASGATANSTDLHLKNRGNHEGFQAMGTVTGLTEALAAKQAALTEAMFKKVGGVSVLGTGDVPLKTVGGQSLVGTGNIPVAGSAAVSQTLAYAGTVTWNATLGTIAFLTLDGDATLALITNPVKGADYRLYVLMGAGGSRKLTLAAGYMPATVTLAAEAGATTILDMSYDGVKMHITNVYREPPSPAPSIPGLWYDPSDMSALYQDSTGTTAVTAAGQPIGRMVDKSSGIHWLSPTASGRPILGARRVNMLLGTAALGAAPWALFSMTFNNGTLTSTDATTSFHRQFVAVVPGTQYTFSFKARKGTATDVKYSVYDATNNLDIVAPTSYNAQINSATEALIQFAFTAPAGCTSVAVYTSRDMPSLSTVTVKEPQMELGAVATAYQAVTAGGDYGAATAPPSISFDGNDSLAAETFVAGTLGANMDCFIPMKRNTSDKVVSLYDKAANGESYVGTMAAVNGTVDLNAGAPTYAINGHVLTAATRPVIEAAIGTGRWSLLEVRNANLSSWTGLGIGGYAGFELNGSLGTVRVMPAQTDAARASIRESLMATYGITAAPLVEPATPSQSDFYGTRVQNLLPLQKQIRSIFYETYMGFTGQYTVNDIDTRFNEWCLFTGQPKVPAGWDRNASKDNYGDGTFELANTGEAQMSNDKLLAAHNRGVRLVLYIGGANAGFNIDTDARRQKLLDSIILMMSKLSAGSGVGNIISGIGWNTFEAYLRAVYANDPANCAANTANMVWISQQLAALYGPNFSIHMPPSSSFSFSPYDIVVARALKATGIPFMAAPQNYDDDYSTKTVGVVSTNNKQWAADLGQDSVMIGLACGFKGSYAKAMTMPFMQTELNNYLAAYPNIRGFFLWSQHDKINADMPAWMNYVINKIPGKA